MIDRETAARDERYLLARSRRLVREAQANVNSVPSSLELREKLAKTERRDNDQQDADRKSRWRISAADRYPGRTNPKSAC
jgi:hypothetical protein